MATQRKPGKRAVCDALDELIDAGLVSFERGGLAAAVQLLKPRYDYTDNYLEDLIRDRYKERRGSQPKPRKKI